MTALYRRLLGARFDQLPPQVGALHDVDVLQSWMGRADVHRGQSLAARSIAALFRLPPQGIDQSLAVTFAPKGEVEVWTRAFGSRRFVSTQYADGQELRERVGPVVLHMTLQQDEECLALSLTAARLFGLPLPAAFLPLVRTHEYEREGRYHFEVEAVVPAFGLLVRYNGWLERAAT